MFRLICFILGICSSLPAICLPVFTQIDVSAGLSDNQVQHILQLPDGRMVFTTRGNINLYDGSRFRYIHKTDKHVYELPDYHGAYHVYAGKNDWLWVKDWNKLWCLDLKHERYVENLDLLFEDWGVPDKVTDLFIDSQQGIWPVTAKGVWNLRNQTYLRLPSDKGLLQDVDIQQNRLYLFFHTGEVIGYDLSTHRILCRKSAYPPEEQKAFRLSSLVVQGPDRKFYQLRNGNLGGCFVFDPQTQSWEKLMQVPYTLHTLIVPSSEQVYITCGKGIWQLDLPTRQHTYLPTLQLADGKQLHTTINTIYQDAQKGLWLGTYNQGLFYAHTQRFKFTSSAGFPKTVQDSVLGSRPHRPSSFRGKAYTDVYTDSRGWTWAGSPDGLHLFQSEHHPPRVFYTEDGLVNNFIHAITEDHHQGIWVSTSNGISHISPPDTSSSLTFTNYLWPDGTLKGEYLDRQAYTLPDKQILMGGIEGWTLFHPDSVTVPIIGFHPLLISVSLYDTPLSVSPDSPNAVPLDKAPPYTDHYEFTYRQNTLAFDFSALNYALPGHTYYRYRLVHPEDSTWHTVHAKSPSRMVDEKGILHLSFVQLPPGKYRLQVMASTHPGHWKGKVKDVCIVIHAPWWRTTWAYISYILLASLFACFGVGLYVHIARLRIQRQHKEEILLLRIQHLIERCHQYEQQVACNEATQEIAPESTPNHQDNEFISKAISLVEANLNTPGYSVEQLSKDLCMERTGLYKKLTSILDKSPSLFIRSIRLKRAADLILEGKMSITAIAEQVGFSSTSYMSKCFQEEFGCKPSEYPQQVYRKN